MASAPAAGLLSSGYSESFQPREQHFSRPGCRLGNCGENLANKRLNSE